MSLKVKIAHTLLLSCKKATQLMEKRLHFKLNGLDRLRLQWHKKACQYCDAYDAQIQVIHKVLEKTMEQHSEPKYLSDEEKTRIQKTIEEQLK